MTETELHEHNERTKAEIVDTITFVRGLSRGSVSHALTILIMAYYVLLISNIKGTYKNFADKKIATTHVAKGALDTFTDAMTEDMVEAIFG